MVTQTNGTKRLAMPQSVDSHVKQRCNIELSDVKIGKKTPFTLDRFEEVFRLLAYGADGDRSWSAPVEDIVTKNHDLKAVNPHAKGDANTFNFCGRYDGD